MMPPAAILCGGKGTRLYPLTLEQPKALVEIAGEPFIAHQLRLLAARGVRRAVLCVGVFGEMLERAVGDGRAWGVEVEYSFDGPVLLGTAGALRQALPRLGPEFFVLYGDSYLPCDYGAARKVFEESGKQALMTVYRNEGRWDTSNVEMRDGSLAVYDKEHRTPAMRHIDYGLGLFRAEAFDRVAPGARYDLAELYRELLAEGQLVGYEVAERFYEIGSFQGLEELAGYLAKSI